MLVRGVRGHPPSIGEKHCNLDLCLRQGMLGLIVVAHMHHDLSQPQIAQPDFVWTGDETATPFYQVVGLLFVTRHLFRQILLESSERSEMRFMQFHRGRNELLHPFWVVHHFSVS
ncbi:hypothetical protein D3C71_971490 [compost metagenome]